MAQMSGAWALIELLSKEGVKYIFGLPGATEILFLDALKDHPEITYILGLHEVVVLGMAEGYARTSGKVGVVNLHTAAGLTAAMPMIFNARLNRVPLLITAGQQDSRLLMQEPGLTGDLVKMAAPLTKWSTEVFYASDIPRAIQRGIKVACHPPEGPVFISLPQDVLGQKIDFNYIPREKSFTRLRPDLDAIHKAAKLLIGAKSPLIIVESGVAKSEAMDETVELAELIGAPVYDTWMAEVNFPMDHPQYMGDLNLGSPQSQEILKKADVLIAIGVPVFRQPFYLPEPLLTHDTKVIHIDNDPWEIGKNFPHTVGIEGNIKNSLKELNNLIKNVITLQVQSEVKTRVDQIVKEKKKAIEAFFEKAKKEKDKVPIAISRLMQEIRDSIRPGTLIVDDCWSSSPVLRKTFDFKEPKCYQRTRGGSIGWGMSGSIGVKLASPERDVVAIVGDGSAIWSIQSLWTAAHYDIPVIYIVCANASYCQVKLAKRFLLGDEIEDRYLGLDFDEPRIDFSKLASSMGVCGKKVERPEKLRDAIRSALELSHPVLVEVIVERIL